MSIWVDQVSLYCDHCESHKQVSVNMESWAMSDSISANLENTGWEITQENGKDDIVTCPSCA